MPVPYAGKQGGGYASGGAYGQSGYEPGYDETYYGYGEDYGYDGYWEEPYGYAPARPQTAPRGRGSGGAKMGRGRGYVPMY